MRANPYNWMKQSRQHRSYGASKYPVMAGLAGCSNGYPAFALQVQSLPTAVKERYAQEWHRWNQDFGKAWDRIGCIQEQSLGQYTDKYREREWMPSLGNLGQGGSLRRGPRHLIGSFDTSVGAKDRPPIPYGHKLYPFPPESGIKLIGSWQPVPGYPLWTSAPAEVKGYKYTSYLYIRADLQQKYMTSSGPGTVSKPVVDESPVYHTDPSIDFPGDSPTDAVDLPVTEASAGGDGIPKWVWLLGGGALIAFGLSRMKKRKKGKR